MGVTEIYTARDEEEDEEKTLQHERKYVGEHLNISYSANKRNNNNKKKEKKTHTKRIASLPCKNRIAMNQYWINPIANFPHLKLINTTANDE